MGLLAATGACSGPPVAAPSAPAPTQPAAATSTAPSSPAATSTPTPASPSASPTAPAAGALSRQEVVSRHEGSTPTWFGLEGPGITSSTGAAGVCLTLDACGGPQGSGVDEALVGFLLDQGVAFTAFLNSRWIQANPALTERLASHAQAGTVELANHGTWHKPLSVNGASAYSIAGTNDVGEVYDEIMGCQQALEEATGAQARWMRPGTAHWDDVALAVAADLGLGAAGFNRNGDGGATFSRSTVARQVGQAQAGDIVIAHMNQPGASTGAGIMDAVPGLLAAGTTFLTLSDAFGA